MRIVYAVEMGAAPLIASSEKTEAIEAQKKLTESHPDRAKAVGGLHGKRYLSEADVVDLIRKHAIDAGRLITALDAELGK